MAHAPRNHSKTYSDQLWNVSLLPMTVAAPRRCTDLPPGPGPRDGGSALRSAALLSASASEFEIVTVTARAA
jgi:hypothetical protein